MDASAIEVWSFGRAVAAEIAGVEDGQLANWLSRHDLFPEKKQGRGYHLYFKLSDIMLVAGIKELVKGGLGIEVAVAALRPYGGPYRFLWEPGARSSNGIWAVFPGTFYLTQNRDGRWVGTDGEHKASRLELRSWPILDELFPRFKSAILSRYGAADPSEVAKAFNEFEFQIADRRKLLWE